MDLVHQFIDKVMQSIDAPLNPSHYIRGPRGSGKTVFLHMVARELQKRGHKVVFLYTANLLPSITSTDLEVVLSSLRPGQIFFLLIDEVQCCPNTTLWDYLLKIQRDIVTIGAGVTKVLDASPCITYKNTHTYLLLSPDDVKVGGEIHAYFSSLLPPLPLLPP